MRQRVRFTKLGKIRFLSHRDIARVWERGLRRAGIRVVYSEGYSPRPRVSFGLALSTGYESLGEYLDVDLEPEAAVEPAALPAMVSPHLPDGMDVQAAVSLPAGADSLQQAVTSCAWRMEVVGPGPAELADTAAAALAAAELPTVVERKGSQTTIDARPAILSLAAADDAPQPAVSSLRPTAVLEATLATQPRSLRPAELLRALDASWQEGRVLRTHQWTLVDGARCEPIPLGDVGASGATPAPHARARAS